MSSHVPCLAFFSLGPGEMLAILVFGLLLFGRRLPEVGRQLGKSLLEFRKGLNSFRREMDLDDDMRETRNTMREIHREFSRPMEIEPWTRSQSAETETEAKPTEDSAAGEAARAETPNEPAPMATNSEPSEPPSLEPPSLPAPPGIDDGAPSEERKDSGRDV